VNIKCVVACINASGESDFYFCQVACSPEEYDEGAHYEAAENLAATEGYEGPMVTFDENDGPSWLFEHFVWDSALTTTPEEFEDEDEDDDDHDEDDDDEWEDDDDVE
jgi:hypothetical protein